jgi:hypothetical protein
MTRWIAVFVVASTVMLVGDATGEPKPAETTRQVYISATDASGAPVADLTAADVAVKEDGKERPVASLQPAAAPMQVAILVEDAGVGAFQSGVAQFLQRSIGHGQFSITVLTPQATLLVDFTDDVAALKTALGRLGARGRVHGDGDQMLDAIARAAKSLQQRKAERPIILALTGTGGQPQSIEPSDVLTTVRSSRAQLNVLFVTGAELGMVLGDGPGQSGGRIEQVGSVPAIPAALVKIADRLQRQYLLTYTLPDGVKPSERLNVSTSRKGITLTAPSRIATK